MDWENQVAEDVNEWVFSDGSVNLTTAGDIKIAKGIVHSLLIRINVYLRGDAVSGGPSNLFGTQPGFPQFTRLQQKKLNKLKRKQMTTEALPMTRGGW